MKDCNVIAPCRSLINRNSNRCDVRAIEHFARCPVWENNQQRGGVKRKSVTARLEVSWRFYLEVLRSTDVGDSSHKRQVSMKSTVVLDLL